MENGRVRVDADEVERTLAVYGTPNSRRSEVIEVAALTQDVYMGRTAKNPAEANALETIAEDP
ncbi:hypothetical protein OG555_24230 [Kribbella sp. NBC_01484]